MPMLLLEKVARTACLLAAATIIMAGAAAEATTPRKLKDRTIEGRITNAVTGYGLKDTINVEVLTLDSVMLVAAKAKNYYNNWPDETSIRTVFDLPIKSDGSDVIIRLSHPDYETACYTVKANKLNNSAGFLKIRRLSRYEKGIMLGEVTVQTSLVQFVNKGDTISYNADAFQVAQGSMLDGLLKQMPGVRLEDGRITVNGRFVEKLLLDGKDFFKGDQLVLLQNLPTYTIKSVDVYEEAGGITEVLGKAAMDLNDRDKYVMDVRLKKGYNAGWLANAEAGAGTHKRYRGRAFGAGYTRSVRIGAYGYINNLSEDRTPGLSGGWSAPDAGGGITAAKGTGVTYMYTTPGRNIEIAGEAAAQYGKMRLDKTVSRQNFLSTGDTYTRNWTNGLTRDLMLRTNHRVTIRPKQGNAYNNQLQIYFNHNTVKQRDVETRGEFGANPDGIADLRQKLTDGWPDGINALNRYNDTGHTSRQTTSMNWRQSSTFALGHSSNGITISSDGFVRNTHADAIDEYLLQYAGSEPTERQRSNPRKGHSYRYWLGARLTFRLNAWLTVNPFYAFCHEYHFNSDQWYDATAGFEHMLPSMRAESAMRLDPRNSYISGRHHTHHFISLPIGYYRKTVVDGKDNSSLSIHVQPGMNIMTPRLYYQGEERQTVSRKYTAPETYFSLFWYLPGMAPRLNLEYKITSQPIDLNNLVDVTYTTDPLNLRAGNPDLKYSYTHRFDAGYQSEKWLFGRLMLNAYLAAEIYERQVAMSYAYDEATGVRTYRPVNINGNRTGWLSVQTDLMLDRPKHFKFNNWLWLQPVRSVDMVSTDGFATAEKNVVNSFVVRNDASVEYTRSNYMVALDVAVNTRRVTSSSLGIDPMRITRFNYGIRGRVSLPASLEISTDLKMYSTRGFDDSSMNVNQLIWNARLTKSMLKGSLMVILDGYDMLRRVKSITYSVNAQGRTETWVNSIPSYFMLSLRWNFAKKPRQ